jgi:hypothetical protein
MEYKQKNKAGLTQIFEILNGTFQMNVVTFRDGHTGEIQSFTNTVHKL